MTGLYLLSIKEYASAKTEAVTPEPQENTIFEEKSCFKTDLKIQCFCHSPEQGSNF